MASDVTFEDRVTRIQPLMSVLERRNPADFVNSLLATGYDRFYVRVPDGFCVSLFADDPFPPGYQLDWTRISARETAPMGAAKARVLYLQLSSSELHNVVENPPATLGHIRQGGLQVVLKKDEFIPVSFKYRQGLLGQLVPSSAVIADRTPESFDVRSHAPVVVKTLNGIRSAHSYTIHGIRLHDVYVEEVTSAPAPVELPAESGEPAAVELPAESGEPAPVELPAVSGETAPVELPAANGETVDNFEDLPADPYGLKDSSPLVYELLCLAHENRGGPQNRMMESQLKARFEAVDATYEKNPRPFNNGRDDFARNLVNPVYKYDKKSPPLKPPVPEPRAIPPDDFLDQDFINEGLKRLLYAACCWSDRAEPCLGHDLMKLVDLLRGFGLRDAGEYDPVQRMVYFIAGMAVKRKPLLNDYKDEGGTKKSRR